MPSKKRFILHWNRKTYFSPRAAFEALTGAFKWSTAPKGSSAFIKAIVSKLSGSDYQSCFSIVRDRTGHKKSRRPFFLMLKRLEGEFAFKGRRDAFPPVLSTTSATRVPFVVRSTRSTSDAIEAAIAEQARRHQRDREFIQQLAVPPTWTFTAPMPSATVPLEFQSQIRYYFNPTTQTLEPIPDNGPQDAAQQNSTSRE